MKLTLEERVALIKKYQPSLEITVQQDGDSTLPKYVYIDVTELIDDLYEHYKNTALHSSN